jgi:N-acetylglucosamine kinase-like BadF-type ATPase
MNSLSLRVDPGSGLLLAVEGGGTRSQAALLNEAGRVLAIAESGDVNVNFTAPERARDAVSTAIEEVLAAAVADQVTHVAWAAGMPDLVRVLLDERFPRARLHLHSERDVVFARGDQYRPHGVGVVVATGATAWAVRRDDGREAMAGGWGALLGDEGSAWAIGLMGLRAAARAWDLREEPTALVEATRRHFGLRDADFRGALVALAYRKPLSRSEVAGFAPEVTRLATTGDAVAARIVEKVARDLAALVLHTAGRLFLPAEPFDVVVAGGLVNAGELALGPLRHDLATRYAMATFHVGHEEPAVALGRLALYDLIHE